MEEKVSGKTRNVIVYVLFCLTIAGIVVSFSMGSKQDQQFTQNTQLYKQAEQKMKEKKFTEAEKMFEQLLDAHPDSYILHWHYAISLSAQQKYDEASEYFTKTQKQRPFIVQNQQYLMQFGEVLYRQGNYVKAKRYLEEGKKINTNPELSAMVQPMLDDIDKKLGIK